MPRRQIASQLLCLAILIAVARLYTYHEPLEMDAATYAVIAHELSLGRSLYTDLWDHKPPAIHATFLLGQSLLGYGPEHVYALGVIAAVLTMAGVYAAAAVRPFGPAVGLWAAAFWALISGDLYLQANQPNTEVFQNLCLIWVFALLLRLPAESLALGRLLAVGVLAALASLYKHVALVTAVGLLVAHLVAPPKESGSRRRALLQSVLALVPVAVVWGLVILYFAATGRLSAFWGAVFLFNRQYAGEPLWNVLLGFTPSWLLPTFLYSLLPLIVLSVLGACAPRHRAPTRVRALLGAYALTTAVSISLPGRFFEHYYQLWMPLLAVTGAWGLAALQPDGDAARGRWLGRAGLSAALVLLALQLPYYRLAPQEWSLRKFGGRLLNSRAVADLINHTLGPGETFFEWGHEAELYYYSGRRPPGPELRSEHLLSGPNQEARSRKLIADLAHQQPELVLISGQFRFPLEHPVPQWLLQHYDELPDATNAAWRRHGFRAFCRRGGELARRLHEQQTAAVLPAPLS